MMTPAQMSEKLRWPDHRPLSYERHKARYGPSRNGKVRPWTLHEAFLHLCAEFKELHKIDVPITRFIVTSNQPKSTLDTWQITPPKNPGVAVWFELDGEAHCLASDWWDLPSANLHSIALHLECMRGIDRHHVGTVSQALGAYQALPKPVQGTNDTPTVWQEPPTHSTNPLKRLANTFKLLPKTRLFR